MTPRVSFIERDSAGVMFGRIHAADSEAPRLLGVILRAYGHLIAPGERVALDAFASRIESAYGTAAPHIEMACDVLRECR